MATENSDQTQDTVESVGGRPLPKLSRYFKAMVKADASDLHLKPDMRAHVRIRGSIRAVQSEPISSQDIAEMSEELMTEDHLAWFHDHGSVDIAYELPGSDRFRINVFLQRGKHAMAVRRVTKGIPTIEELHLPPVVTQIAKGHQGLVLLSGPTGGGKTTTISGMIEYINQTRACHIITLEDPIEYLYESKKSLISQREIGIDVDNFEEAIRYLLREDPDVVLIGELRDYETFQAALHVAETGHLVFATLHASGAAQTIGRVLDLFPVENRDRIRTSLGFNLRAIVCQQLLPSIADGVERVPATEVLMMTPHVRNLIAEGRDEELTEVIRGAELEGMHTFTASLFNLIEDELIDPQVAYEVASNPDELSMMLKGISAGGRGSKRT